MGEESVGIQEFELDRVLCSGEKNARENRKGQVWGRDVKGGGSNKLF